MKKEQKDLESDIKSIATSIANVFYKSYKNYLNYDDLLHEAYEAAIAAKNTFDETRGTSFEPYLKACVRNKLINYVKKKIKTKEMEVILPDDNNDGVFRKEVTLEDMENSILLKDIEHFMMTHQDLFSNDDLTIFHMRAMGSSYKEIAEKINKNTKYVDNSLRRIKKIVSERFGI
jgi:RNA polymerase sigma factor (sigma-70 family)